VKLWDWKFVAGLVFLAAYTLNALARPLNESTGERPPLIPGTEHTIFSFIFLLVFLFTLSHLGSWVMSKIRHRDGEPSIGHTRKHKHA
jgi:hypothetical protein